MFTWNTNIYCNAQYRISELRVEAVNRFSVWKYVLEPRSMVVSLLFN